MITAWRADPIHALTGEDGRVTQTTKEAANRWDELLWGTWLRAHTNGILKIEGRAPREVVALVNGVAAVGIVHDHPLGVGPDGELTAWPERSRRDASGFVPVPNELAEAIFRTHEALPDHDLIVAGHGIATDDDAWQEELLAQSISLVRSARSDARLVGYFHDAGVDGYEWKKGYDAPRGLLRRDRSRRPAAHTFAIASTN